MHDSPCRVGGCLGSADRFLRKFFLFSGRNIWLMLDFEEKVGTFGCS